MMTQVVDHDFQEQSLIEPGVCDSCNKKSFRLCRICGSCYICHSEFRSEF